MEAKCSIALFCSFDYFSMFFISDLYKPAEIQWVPGIIQLLCGWSCFDDIPIDTGAETSKVCVFILKLLFIAIVEDLPVSQKFSPLEILWCTMFSLLFGT